MTDLDELERLAKAATPGPWHVGEPRELYDRPCVFGHGPNGTLPGVAPDVFRDADAAYIAALSPDVVLGLIAGIRAADRMGRAIG